MATISEKLTIKITANTASFTKGMAGVTRRIKRFGAAANKRFTSAVRGSKLFMLALGGVGIAVTKMAVNFETGMAKISTLIDNVTQNQMKDMRLELLEMSNRYGRSSTEMAEGMYQVLSATVPLKDSMAFMNQASKLAIAGFADQDKVVRLLASIMNAYGKTVKDVKDISDTLIMTQNRGILTVGDLVKTYGRLIGVAANVGIEFREISAGVATLTAMGVPVRESVTALRQALVSILKPTQEAKDLARELNIDWSIQAIRAKGLVRFFGDLRKTFGDNLDTLVPLVGNVRALTAVMNLAGHGAERFKNNLEDMNNAAGITDEAFAKMAATTGFQLKQLWTQLTNIGIVLATAVLPYIQDLIKEIGLTNLKVRDMKKAVDVVRRSVEGLVLVFHAVMLGAKFLGAGLAVIVAPLEVGIRKFGAVWTSIWSGMKISVLKLLQVLERVGHEILRNTVLAARWVAKEARKIDPSGAAAAIHEIAERALAARQDAHSKSINRLKKNLDAEMKIWKGAQKEIKKGWDDSVMMKAAKRLKKSANDSLIALKKQAERIRTSGWRKELNEQRIKELTERVRRDKSLKKDREAAIKAREIQFQKEQAIRQHLLSTEKFIQNVYRQRVSDIKASLKEAYSAEVRHVEKIKALQRELFLSRESLEERIFQLRQEGLTEEGKKIQVKGMGETFMTRAKEAINRGDFEEVKRLAGKAQNYFENLASMSKDWFNREAAISSMMLAQNLIEKAIKEQQKQEQESLNATRARILELRLEIKTLYEQVSQALVIKVDTRKAKKKLQELKEMLGKIPQISVNPKARVAQRTDIGANIPTGFGDRGFVGEGRTTVNNDGSTSNSNDTYNLHFNNATVTKETVRNVIMPEIQRAKQRGRA